jgi:hypothetical protein
VSRIKTVFVISLPLIGTLTNYVVNSTCTAEIRCNHGRDSAEVDHKVSYSTQMQSTLFRSHQGKGELPVSIDIHAYVTYIHILDTPAVAERNGHVESTNDRARSGFRNPSVLLVGVCVLRTPAAGPE